MKKISLFFCAVAVALLALAIVDLIALSYPERFCYWSVLLAAELTEEPDRYIKFANPV
jgi:hypothetical protein